MEVNIPNADGTSISRTRCPVWEIKDSSCFKLSGNGELNYINDYTFQDISILNDEDGYCLLTSGVLDRRVNNFDNWVWDFFLDNGHLPANPTFYARCEKEDRRAPFADCSNCTEGFSF